MWHGAPLVLVMVWFCVVLAAVAGAAEPATFPATPEAVVREMVLANERRDLEGMARLSLKDPDIVYYGIAGLRFAGWDQVEQALRMEFQTVTRLDMAIKELKVWTRGDVAWFAMALDYTRVLPGPQGETRMLLELHDTGVLEKRDGRWLFHSWHESARRPLPSGLVGQTP